MLKRIKEFFLKIYIRIPTPVLIVIALAVAVVLPLFNVYGTMSQVWVRLAARAAILVILALGLNIIIGDTGLLNLGYIAFFAIGAYSTAILASPRFGLHLPFWLLILIGGLLAMIFGLLLGLPTLRLRGDYLAIVTLAFGEIIRITANNWETLTNGPGGIPFIDQPQIFSYRIDTNIEYYYLALVAITISIILIYNLKNSRIGRAWNALREDEIAAESMGINVANAKLLSFMISAIFAGVAGSIFASFQQFVNPQYFIFMQSVLVVCMVVLGGMGSIAGGVAGAIFIDATPEIIRHSFSDWLPSIFGANFYANWPQFLQNFFLEFDRYRLLIFGILIVLMMIFRPEGIIPNRRRQRELHETDPRVLAEMDESQYGLEEGKKDLEV